MLQRHGAEWSRSQGGRWRDDSHFSDSLSQLSTQPKEQTRTHRRSWFLKPATKAPSIGFMFLPHSVLVMLGSVCVFIYLFIHINIYIYIHTHTHHICRFPTRLLASAHPDHFGALQAIALPCSRWSLGRCRRLKPGFRVPF